MFQKNSSRPDHEESFIPFSKPDRPEAKSKGEKPSKETSAFTVFLSDVEIKGTVKFKHDVVIDGKIEGEIFSDGSVTIGRTASVCAEIRSKNVVVEGRVHGNIYASDRLELAENAEVTGDIKAAVLSMQAGAVLVGSSAVGAIAPSDKRRANLRPVECPPRFERELTHA